MESVADRSAQAFRAANHMQGFGEAGKEMVVHIKAEIIHECTEF
jgi:hypothetical protein